MCFIIGVESTYTLSSVSTQTGTFFHSGALGRVFFCFRGFTCTLSCSISRCSRRLRTFQQNGQVYNMCSLPTLAMICRGMLSFMIHPSLWTPLASSQVSKNLDRLTNLKSHHLCNSVAYMLAYSGLQAKSHP